MIESQCQCRRGPCRPGQRNCKVCHNEAQKAFRAQRKIDMSDLLKTAFEAVKELERLTGATQTANKLSAAINKFK